MDLATEPDAQGRLKVRLFVDRPLAAGAPFELSPDQAHYVTRVMRLGAGDRIALFNGRDGEWSARPQALGKHACSGTVETLLRPQRSVPDLVLLFAPVKRHPLDLLVRQATELGVRLLQPVITERTVPERVNLQRLRAITVEAAEQSERLDVPHIADPERLDRALNGWAPERRLFLCDEAGTGVPVAQAITSSPPGAAGVLCGPEGGFTAAELDRMRQLPFVTPVALGPRILRAETAALAVVSVWQAVRGDWAEVPRRRTAEQPRPPGPAGSLQSQE